MQCWVCVIGCFLPAFTKQWWHHPINYHEKSNIPACVYIILKFTLLMRDWLKMPKQISDFLTSIVLKSADILISASYHQNQFIMDRKGKNPTICVIDALYSTITHSICIVCGNYIRHDPLNGPLMSASIFILSKFCNVLLILDYIKIHPNNSLQFIPFHGPLISSIHRTAFR